ncbi:hypothetical protein BDV18DRAFT_160086 [Aspergillus unguis]
MPSSPHQGGSLSDMAPTGTNIPNDAGKMNTIPSVPRPDQLQEDDSFSYQGQGQPTTAFAADNATDFPRSTRDMGFSGEVTTGTGNTFPAQGENAGNEIGSNWPGAKGSTRAYEHANLNRSLFDRGGESGSTGKWVEADDGWVWKEHEGRNAGDY